jgi:hypothetical protein
MLPGSYRWDVPRRHAGSALTTFHTAGTLHQPNPTPPRASLLHDDTHRSLFGVAAISLLDVQAAAAQGSRAPKPLAPLKVIDTSYMDRSVKACVDFFSFANGMWVKRDTIPPDYSNSGVARDMSDRNELVVRSVLDDVMKRRASLPAASTPRKLGTYYASCMDSTVPSGKEYPQSSHSSRRSTRRAHARPSSVRWRKCK